MYSSSTSAPLLFMHCCFLFLFRSQFSCAQSLTESLPPLLDCFSLFPFVPHPKLLTVFTCALPVLCVKVFKVKESMLFG